MKEFAKDLYLSTRWRKVREFVIVRDHGLCCRCGRPGEVVHHKEHLTARNVTDPLIALGPDNLETLCRECHATEHGAQGFATSEAIEFDAHGNIVRRQENQ